MPINSLILKRDGECLLPGLHEALEALDSAEGELILDFSPVLRIDGRALGAMETLACRAQGKAVKVVLHGVHISVYRVLKLMKLAPRFCFRT